MGNIHFNIDGAAIGHRVNDRLSNGGTHAVGNCTRAGAACINTRLSGREPGYTIEQRSRSLSVRFAANNRGEM